MALLTFPAYVAMTIEKPWQWGVQDCTIWVSDWCRWQWGVDPALPYRGSYSTEAEMQALVDQAGSLIELVRPHLGFLNEKPEAHAGDVGVISVLGRQIAAIRAADKWAFRHDSGISLTDRPALVVWGRE